MRFEKFNKKSYQSQKDLFTHSLRDSQLLSKHLQRLKVSELRCHQFLREHHRHH